MYIHVSSSSSSLKIPGGHPIDITSGKVIQWIFVLYDYSNIRAHKQGGNAASLFDENTSKSCTG